MNYPHVFRPIKIGPVEIANRFYQSPHAMPMNIGGKPTDDYVAYAVERARGGVGLLMASMTIPERSKSIQPSPSSRKNIAALRVVADAVHEAGAKIFVEPYYQWLVPGNWQPFSPPAPALGPSASQASYYGKRSSTRPMSLAEIKYMIEAIRTSTANLREAGFDGVMLHAAHGALLEQFLSPYFNRRTDEYGGTLDNRMRIVIQALEAAREAADGRIAVGMRLNCDELLPGGYGKEDAARILSRLVDKGLLDFIDLDIAVEPEQFYIGMASVFVAPHPYRPYVESVRSAAGNVPVLSVLGRVTSVAEAETAIAEGVCDMVGAARAFIAEPRLVRNALEGKEAQSRPCIACNTCMAAGQDNAQMCAVNPVAYRERIWGAESIRNAPSRCKVIVVGGGPAGMEAARAAAMVGHDVRLLDRASWLGGSLRLWSLLPGREFYLKAVQWWERELDRLGVSVELDTNVTAAILLASQPDAVILATGAAFCADGRSNQCDQPIPGHNGANVTTPDAILDGRVKPHGHVVVIDGEVIHAGVGAAEVLAGQGCKVTLVTPYFAPVSPRVIAAQESMFIMQRLRAANVTILASSWVSAIEKEAVQVYDVYSENKQSIAADFVVLSTGRAPVNDLEASLEGRVKQVFTVGDALAPRIWATAAYEGHKFARLVGQPDAPRSFAEAYFTSDPESIQPLPADMPREA